MEKHKTKRSRKEVSENKTSKFSKKDVHKVARSAVTGRFVKKTYAKSHPKTTVFETAHKKHDDDYPGPRKQKRK